MNEIDDIGMFECESCKHINVYRPSDTPLVNPCAICGTLNATENSKNIITARFVIMSPEIDFNIEDNNIDPMVNNKEEITTILNKLMALGWVVKVSNQYNS